ncbi:MAG: hypothetical protein O8C61_13390, partial [Candidatus Methanoperedens sp.]|nr:hypothetical protein [Candidatus Methanoperedens sp.]
VSWNYKGRIENCRPILKGYGMLEPYAVKVASTVLRRGRAGNRSFLFDLNSCHSCAIRWLVDLDGYENFRNPKNRYDIKMIYYYNDRNSGNFQA